MKNKSISKEDKSLKEPGHKRGRFPANAIDEAANKAVNKTTNKTTNKTANKTGRTVQKTGLRFWKLSMMITPA